MFMRSFEHYFIFIYKNVCNIDIFDKYNEISRKTLLRRPIGIFVRKEVDFRTPEAPSLSKSSD